MYRLMVSEDCGMSYDCLARSEKISDLKAKAIELKLDEQYLRWTIEDETTEEIFTVSKVHKHIIKAFGM